MYIDGKDFSVFSLVFYETSFALGEKGRTTDGVAAIPRLDKQGNPKKPKVLAEELDLKDLGKVSHVCRGEFKEGIKPKNYERGVIEVPVYTSLGLKGTKGEKLAGKVFLTPSKKHGDLQKGKLSVELHLFKEHVKDLKSTRGQLKRSAKTRMKKTVRRKRF
jgi:hypothetical protein